MFCGLRVTSTLKGSVGETLAWASSEATRSFQQQNTACAAECTDGRVHSWKGVCGPGGERPPLVVSSDGSFYR